jgi:hypothetical protein
MSLKLWDLAMEGAPVASLQVHEEVRPRVSRCGCLAAAAAAAVP